MTHFMLSTSASVSCASGVLLEKRSPSLRSRRRSLSFPAGRLVPPLTRMSRVWVKLAFVSSDAGAQRCLLRVQTKVSGTMCAEDLSFHVDGSPSREMS